MKKFSQISQLNDPNKNTLSCDYYGLTINPNLGVLRFEVGGGCKIIPPTV